MSSLLLTFDRPAGPDDVPGRMAYAIDALCFIVARFLVRFVPQEQSRRIHNHIRRIGNRFAALHARYLAGTLPAPRLRATSAAPRRQGTVPLVKLPRRAAWLFKLLPEAGRRDVSGFAYQLRVSLERDSAMLDFLAAAPQAGRLLRPLLRMLSPDPLPPCLRLPPRPPRPRETIATAPARPKRAASSRSGPRPADLLPPPTADAAVAVVVAPNDTGSALRPTPASGPPPAAVPPPAARTPRWRAMLASLRSGLARPPPAPR